MTSQNTSKISANTANGLKVADMIQSGNQQQAAIERGPGLFESRGVGNSYLITTEDGNVLVNAGTLGDAKRGKVLFDQISDHPIKQIILTQSHPNQFGGLEVYKTPDNQVIAHRIYPQDRVYSKALLDHYQRGSRRIFRSVIGPRENIMPTAEVAPDLLIDQFHAIELGGRHIELHWTPGGETRSALIVWLPQEKIAIVGNLFGPLFGNHPNLNTLRGDKPRSALEFIESVTLLRELGPELILTGHEAIDGAAHLQSELTRIINSVQWVHDRTIEGMNAGKTIQALMAEIKTPPELTLTEEYGRLPWNIRAIWHEYSGWFEAARGTTELYEVPPSAVAPALIELCGSTHSVVTKAQSFIDNGQPLHALHLLDIVLAAEPDHSAARQTKQAALLLLLQQQGESNLWERMWIKTAIEELAPLP